MTAARRGAANVAPPPVASGSIIVLDPLQTRTLDLTAPTQDIWVRIRNGFAVPNLISPLVTERQAWYLTKPEYFLRTVERSGIYLYYIVEQLEKRGLPTELALLPFIESAYNPMAYSRAHASGMWQFIPSTGKSYNLKQDWWRDERRDVIASTEAALTYLQTIYEMHGDWHLALASYNWGEGAVKRAIEKNRAQGMPTDYLSLSMPDETRNYIPKLQAVKNIIAHPELFGIKLPRVGNEPYFATVIKNRDIDIATAAKLAEMPLADFKALNPSFNRPVIAGNTSVLVPANKISNFHTNFANHDAPLSNWQSYTVKRGDRFDRIASRFGMSVANLRQVNDIGAKDRPRPGVTLLVARASKELQTELQLTQMPKPANEARVRSVVLSAKPTAKIVRTYVVRRGDTLFEIAQKFGLTPDALRKHNGLKRPTISAGQRLKLPM